jgi:hypothetical protein
MGRPSCLDSASVIAVRNRDSITSRVNASGTEINAMSSTIARSRVNRRYARCCGETISSARASVAFIHTAPRSFRITDLSPRSGSLLSVTASPHLARALGHRWPP